MADLAKLVVRLEAQTATYDAKLEEATRKLRAFGSQTGGTLGLIERNFKKLAAGVTVAGFVAFVKHSIDAADAAGKMAQQVGVSVESLTRLQYAAKSANVDQETLTNALTKFSATAYDASRGNEAATKALRAFGITAKDLKGLSLDQQFLVFADRVAKFADSGDKAAGVEDVLGKNMRVLIPLLNGGSAGFKDLADESDRLGATIDTKTTEAAARFNEALGRMGTIARGLGFTILKELLPHFENLEKKIGDPKFQADMKEVADGIVKIGSGAFTAAKGVSLFVNSMAFLGEAAAAGFNGHAVGDMVRITEDLAYAQETLRLMDEKGYSEAAKQQTRLRIADLERRKKLTEEVLALQSPAVTQREQQAANRQPKPPPPHGGATFVGVDELADKRGKEIDDYIQSLKEKVQTEGAAIQSEDLYTMSMKGSGEAQAEATKRADLYKLTVLKANEGQMNLARLLLDNAVAFGRQKDQLDLAKQTYEDTRTRVEKLAAALQKLNELRGLQGQDGKPLVDDETLKRAEAALRLSGLQADAQRVTNDLALQEERIRNSQEVGAIGELEAMQELGDERQKAVAQLEGMVALYDQLAQASQNPDLIEGAARFRVELEKLKGQADVVGNQFRSELKSDFAAAFETIIKDVHNAGDAFRNFFDAIASYLTKLAAQELAQAIVGGGSGIFDKVIGLFLNAYGGGGTGTGSSAPGGDYGDFGTGVRAGGGPVSANEPYLVGERGPEMFVPSAAGRIVPNDKAMGQEMSVHLHVSGVTDADSFQRSQAQILNTLGTAVLRARQRNS